jgi:hypothetical protein
MALTETAAVTKGRKNDAWGARRATILTINLGNAYVTNGLSFDPKAFGHVGAVSKVLLFPRYASGATGPITRNFFYDYTNKKIVVIINSTGVEQGNGGNLSSCTLDVVVLSD